VKVSHFDRINLAMDASGNRVSVGVVLLIKELGLKTTLAFMPARTLSLKGPSHRVDFKKMVGVGD